MCVNSIYGMQSSVSELMFKQEWWCMYTCNSSCTGDWRRGAKLGPVWWHFVSKLKKRNDQIRNKITIWGWIHNFVIVESFPSMEKIWNSFPSTKSKQNSCMSGRRGLSTWFAYPVEGRMKWMNHRILTFSILCSQMTPVFEG